MPTLIKKDITPAAFPRREGFDPVSFRNSPMVGHLKLRGFKDSTMPNGFFAGNTNPFKVLVEPQNKTVLRYLRDFLPHIDGFKRLFAYTLIKTDDNAALNAGLGQLGKQPDYRYIVDEVVKHLNPNIALDQAGALQRNGNVSAELAQDVSREFKFDFAANIVALKNLIMALATSELGKISASNAEIISQGPKTLRSLKGVYEGLRVVYQKNDCSIESLEPALKAFKGVLESLAVKLEKALKAARPVQPQIASGQAR